MNADTGGHVDISLNSSGHVEVRLQSASASYRVESTPGQPISAGQWHHMAFSFGSDGMKLYVDGALADSDPYSGGMGSTSGGIGNYEPIAIGAGTWTSGDGVVTPLIDYFDGSIDEVAIFDQALTAQTIQDLYDAATPEYVVAEGST